jgi:O-methyltransferase involved in polyketide biosynthesis
VPPVDGGSGFNEARLYDFFLGGKDHIAQDRRIGERVTRIVPGADEAARLNRNFLDRVVRALVAEGVTQFIDLGSGLPAPVNVHEMARQVHPRAVVAYVDRDPLVVTHQRAVFAGVPGTVVVQQDLCRPWEVLSDEGLRASIDLDRPVGILLIAVLHLVSHDVAPELIAHYRKVLPAGSCIAMNVICRDGLSPDQVTGLEQLFADYGSPVSLRTSAQIHQLFDGLGLLAPGVVDFTSWRGQDPSSGLPGLAGVGRIG